MYDLTQALVASRIHDLRRSAEQSHTEGCDC